MVALYTATDGANWPFRRKLAGATCQSVPGTALPPTVAACVTRLVIEGNGLTGRLPDLSALTSLTYLTLGLQSINRAISGL